MSLTGREHFYDAWHELVVATVSNAPVLDLGTSQPYRKEMSVLRGHVPTPYFCLDVAGSKAVDREDLIEVRKRTIHEAIVFDASNSAFELVDREAMLTDTDDYASLEPGRRIELHQALTVVLWLGLARPGGGTVKG